MGAFFQPHLVKQGQQAGLRGRNAVELREESQVFQRRQRRVKQAAVADQADILPHLLCFLWDLPAANTDRAAGGFGQPCQQAQECRLATAVWPQKRHKLPVRDAKRYLAQHRHEAIGLTKAFNCDERTCFHHSDKRRHRDRPPPDFCLLLLQPCPAIQRQAQRRWRHSAHQPRC